MSKFYDGTKLLSLKDLDANEPEIYMCVGNRTAGKSYFFKRLLVRKFLKYNEKFCLLVRFSYELSGVAESFFKDLAQIDFKGKVLSSKPVNKGLYQELFLDGEPCGYAVALNTADSLKKVSAAFVDVENIFFDEFQSEMKKYVPLEIEKFVSVHVSIARGGGEHVRRVPVYMASNTVSILNPYFVQFGVHKRLTPHTKYLRGRGWVLEQCYIETAANAIQNSAFGRAFENTDYMSYTTENSYLLDNENFIEKVKGAGKLLCNISTGDMTVGVWEHAEQGVIYCSTKFDPSFPLNITYKTKDHGVNLIMIRRNDWLCKYLSCMFERSCLRFENMQCKDIVLDMLGYSVM